MKAFRLLLLVLVAGFAATIARADVIDPTITIGGGGSCSTQTLTSLTQSFPGIDTSCTTDFVNHITQDDASVTLTQIVVNVTSPFTGPLSCAAASDSPFFGVTTGTSSCTFFVQTILLTSLTSVTCGPNSGLGPGCMFGLTFDNQGGPGFGPTVDLTLSQSVIPTPEPASALLLLTGAGALVALRKRRQAAA